MDADIRAFGQKRDFKNLHNLIKSVDSEEFSQLIEDTITSPVFPDTLHYLMRGFDESRQSSDKRFSVIRTLMKSLDGTDLPSLRCNAIVCRTIDELPKLETKQLVDLTSFCVECIEKGNVTEMCWKDFLPELLNILAERDSVQEMTGIEFKNRVIKDLCLLKWAPSILTSLTSMFRELHLSKEDYQVVINKLSRSVDYLTPQELPPFVYQFLDFCKDQKCKSFFLNLQRYFDVRIGRSGVRNNSSSSGSEDIIENATDLATFEAESTVLYHIYKAAGIHNSAVKDYINFLKNSTKAPEMILQHFQLSLLLTISTVFHFQESALEIIRMSLSRLYNEQQKRNESCWLRENTKAGCNMETIINQLINESIEERYLIMEGLVNLSLILLAVGTPLGQDFVAKKMRHIGMYTLLKLMKRKQHISTTVINTATTAIISGHNVNQHIELFWQICNNMPVIMLNNLTLVLKLVDYLVELPGKVANNLLGSIITLVKYRSIIRDHLCLILRKALYSRSLETRQMAIAGFLQLLKILKISNLAVLSQSSSSSSSFSGLSAFTQISMNTSSVRAPATSQISNEALCLEVLRILKRCFMQQVEVKIHLYEELYRAVCANFELGIPVLDVIWLHFCDFYVLDENELMSLRFSKISQTKDSTVLHIEPLGKLIYTIGLILEKVRESNEDNSTVIRFTKIMTSLSKRMISSELIHFDLDDGTDLMDVLPEAQHKVLVLSEALQTYEALIGYQITAWKDDSANTAQLVSSLFQGYTRLEHFSKNLNPKKLTGAKKKDDSDKSVQSQTNSTLKDAPKRVPFKMPRTLLSFKTLAKVIELLYMPNVAWTSVGQATILKTKHEFHRHMLRATLELISDLKSSDVNDRDEAHETFDYCVAIGTVLYERCIQKMDDLMDFDKSCAALTTECFHGILLYIIQKHHFVRYIEEICKMKGEDPARVLGHLIDTYKNLLTLEDEDDFEGRKITQSVAVTLSLLLGQISSENKTLSSETLQWLSDITSKKSCSNKAISLPIWTAYCSLQIKFKSTLQFFETTALRLEDLMGRIDDDEHSCSELEFLTETIAPNVFTLLCSSVKNVLDDIDWIVNRIKAESTIVAYVSEDQVTKRQEAIRANERSVCCQLCFVVTILTTLSNISIQPGGNLENLLKNLSHIYITLNSLCKHFLQCSSKDHVVFQAARFENLIRIVGKELNPSVYKLILFVDEAQKQDDANTQSKQIKRKTPSTTTLKSKLLKETRLIPKVVYDIEQLSKSVALLSNKTAVDLAKHLGQGITRDFRIVGLKEVVEKSGDVSMDVTSADDSRESGSGETVGDQDEDSEEECEDSQAVKRARKGF